MIRESRITDWQQRLQTLKDENAQLKVELAERIRQDVHTDSLGSFEHFQTRLLDNDIAIGMIRNELSRATNNASLNNGALSVLEDVKMETIVRRMEQEWEELKLAFLQVV